MRTFVVDMGDSRLKIRIFVNPFFRFLNFCLLPLPHHHKKLVYEIFLSNKFGSKRIEFAHYLILGHSSKQDSI